MDSTWSPLQPRCRLELEDLDRQKFLPTTIIVGFVGHWSYQNHNVTLTGKSCLSGLTPPWKTETGLLVSGVPWSVSVFLRLFVIRVTVIVKTTVTVLTGCLRRGQKLISWDLGILSKPHDVSNTRHYNYRWWKYYSIYCSCHYVTLRVDQIWILPFIKVFPSKLLVLYFYGPLSQIKTFMWTLLS